MGIRIGHRALLLALLATACGGDGSSGSSPVTVVGGGLIPAPGPSPTPTPTPTSTPVPLPSPTPVAQTMTGDFATDAAALYDAQPSVDGCVDGKLKSSVTQGALASLNAIRALHGLPAVSYSSNDEAGEQRSALMQAANQALSHTPPSTWKCWTQAGSDASGQSNLAIAYGDGLKLGTDESILAGWMTETANVSAGSIGHRRWMLDPFLGTVAYGRVAGPTSGSFVRVDAASLRVFGQTGAKAPFGTLPDFFAYPQGDYPARFWADGATLSFSAIADKVNEFGNASVDFSKATVSVVQRGGSALTVSGISYDNLGYGVPDSIQFSVAGLQRGVQYDVTISGVSGAGAKSSYAYSFRIVD